MSELKGSKTEKNLPAACTGESQARNRYTYFASQAKQDGFEHIAAIFEETANQEKEHTRDASSRSCKVRRFHHTLPRHCRAAPGPMAVRPYM